MKKILSGLMIVSFFSGCALPGPKGEMQVSNFNVQGVLKSIEAGQHDDTEIRFGNGYGAIVPFAFANFPPVVSGLVNIQSNKVEITPESTIVVEVPTNSPTSVKE